MPLVFVISIENIEVYAYMFNELFNDKFLERKIDAIKLEVEHAELLNSKINADEEISVKFYNEYRQIRLVLFRHIISLNKELDNEQAIAMAQKVIDRIIFVCFCEDLGILPYKIVRTIIDEYNHSTFKLSQTQLWDNLKNLFTAIDKGYPERDINHFNGGLFKYDKELDSLPIRNDVILELLNLERYDFESDLNVKILGHIFEQSIN